MPDTNELMAFLTYCKVDYGSGYAGKLHFVLKHENCGGLITFCR